MSKLLLKKKAGTGRVAHVTPENAGWTYVGFDLHRLNPGDTVAEKTGGREVCLVLRHRQGEDFRRRQGFRPARRAHEPVRRQTVVGLCAAGLRMDGHRRHRCRTRRLLGPGLGGGLPARVIAPDDLGQETRGKGTNTRYVTNVLPENQPADSLLVVEVITPGGHTSSYPPHKHDRDDLPRESYLEETYYHRFNPPQGFAFQRVYTDADASAIASWTRRWRWRTATSCWYRRATTPAPPATATTSIISTSWPVRSAPGSSTTRPSMSG